MRAMCEPMNTVLLCCGSFNPITNMHLRMFELAKDYFNRSNDNVVEGIISPVHDSYETNKKLVSALHRCQMIRRTLTAIDSGKYWVHLSEWESQQNDKWLNTVQVLEHHFRQLNAHNEKGRKTSLKLLCGADLFQTFNVPNLWKDEHIEKIVGEYGLVVISREGFDAMKTLQESDKSSILLKHKDNIRIINDKIVNAISSTAIREAVKNRESIKFLVQEPVIDYIETHKLYK